MSLPVKGLETKPAFMVVFPHQDFALSLLVAAWLRTSLVSTESLCGKDCSVVRHWVGISLCNWRQGASYNISMLGFPNQKLDVVPLSILRWARGAVGNVVLQWGGMGGNTPPLRPSLAWRSLLLYLTQIFSAANDELVKGCPAQGSVVGPSRWGELGHGCPQPWLHLLQPRAAPSRCPWTWMPTSAPCSTAAPPAPCRGTRPATRRPHGPSPASPPPPTSGITRTS